MTALNKTNTGRRSFFLRGGAAIGAGLASASAGAGTLMLDSSLSLKEQIAQLNLQLGAMEDKDAISQLQLAYATLLENGRYEAVVELFSEDASLELYGEMFVGKEKEIKTLFTKAYAEQQVSAQHTAFRQDQAQQQDVLKISQDLQSAKASFHLQVEVSKPQTGTAVLGEMARLQGQDASRQWESGRFDVAYRKIEGQWKISKLSYRS